MTFVEKSQLGKSDCVPNFIFSWKWWRFGVIFINVISNGAKQSGINYEDIAILSPTRGRMMGNGNLMVYVLWVIYFIK